MKKSLMPLPIEMTLGDGELVVDNDFKICLIGFAEPRLERAALRLAERLSQITGITIQRNWAIAKEDALLIIHVDEISEEVKVPLKMNRIL